MAREQAQPTKTRKIAAISAGALVIGLGAVYTLASWNDSEWVWGGAEGGPGIGTSTFNIQQNTNPDLVENQWVDEESNPGGEMTFTPGALALTPGDVTYAPVSIRADETSVAGEVQLQGAVAADGVDTQDAEDLLWNAIQVDVWVSEGDGVSAPTCDADFAGAAGATQIVTAAGLDAVASAKQRLEAEAGNVQNYCFAITLPDDPGNQALQGRTIAPAWEFAAQSD